MDFYLVTIFNLVVRSGFNNDVFTYLCVRIDLFSCLAYIKRSVPLYLIHCERFDMLQATNVKKTFLEGQFS